MEQVQGVAQEDLGVEVLLAVGRDEVVQVEGEGGVGQPGGDDALSATTLIRIPRATAL